MMKNKKGFEFSFGWIFAIVVGAAVIFLAIYASSNLIREERKVSATEAGKQLGIILNPIETSIESGRIDRVAFPEETRVFNKCLSTGDYGAEKTFGGQDISIASKSGGGAWEKPGVASTFYNKYIFSSSTIEGKEIKVFSKPFYMPFKIADVLFMWNAEKKYCFVNPPSYIEKELEDLNVKNFNVTDEVKKCEKNSEKVCFTSSESVCNVIVNLNSKSVKKNKQILYYEDDKENVLLYGTIFADSGIYECQVKRLMARASELSSIYGEKSQSLSIKGCSSNLEQELFSYADATRKLNSSLDLNEINNFAEELGRRNALLACKLF